MTTRFPRLLGTLFGLALFAAALLVLNHTLQGYRYADILHAVAGIPGSTIALATGLTLLSYASLALYDLLAFRYIGVRFGYAKIVITSFIGYAFSHNLGFALLSGGSVRFRLYSAWGLSATQIARIVVFCGVMLWLGFFVVGGLLFLIEPVSLPAQLRLPAGSLHPLGVAMLLAAAAYLAASFLRRAPIRLGAWQFTLPPPGLTLAQFAGSAADWIVAGSVLFVLLPEGGVSFPVFLAIFLLAQIAGLISHVPGGLGVFEGIVLMMLTPALPTAAVLGALLAYRAVYYLLPLAVAALSLGGIELLRQRRGVEQLLRWLLQWTPALAPHLFAFTAFVAGAILLVSGATPTVGWRLTWLRDLLPLPLLEVSHFVSSLIGVALLLLARGLQRRLDAAYLLTVALLAAGIVASLLKGLDYEEAIVLGVLLAALLPCRHYFYRKTSLIGERFTPGWLAAIAVIMLACAWVGLFSYQHVEYRDELWWRFTFSGDAPRFLRASTGVIGVLLFVAIARLLRPAAPEPDLPRAVDMERAAAVVADSPVASAHLALLGDKHLLFNDAGTAFIMYGVAGRSFVALGDPVGPRAEWSDLVWRFRELGDRHDGSTVFYQVLPENLPLYLELGLSLLKLGEEARVALAGFTLDGSARKNLRHVINRIDRDGHAFEVVDPAAVAALIPALKSVSDAWLAEKNTREKRFSLGYFEPAYLERLPIAIVRRGPEILAFANLWPGAHREEVSVDLMRYRPDAPEGVMDYLFVKLLLWARDAGYHWFNLGMAPLAGLEDRSLAPIWTRFGALVFRHGEHFYNFQGLRRYKDKFDPVWTPKYLASPGGLTLPILLTQVATLVSGGLRGVIGK